MISNGLSSGEGVKGKGLNSSKTQKYSAFKLVSNYNNYSHDYMKPWDLGINSIRSISKREEIDVLKKNARQLEQKLLEIKNQIKCLEDSLE